MRARRVVQIIGDGASGEWLTWRWSDGRSGVHRVGGLTQAVERFRKALPTPPNPPRRATAAQLAALARTVLRLDGPLTRGDDEIELMGALSAALIPPELAAQLLEPGEPVDVRVAPSPPAAVVAWGLLPLDGHRRLIDVADVSWVGPILPRDIAPAGPSPEKPRGEPLFVINPHGPRVIAPGWERCRCHGEVTPSSSPRIVTPEDLHDRLSRGASRLLMIGHCRTDRGAGETEFQMERPLRVSHLVQNPSKWPMPPRVGVLACASGTDLAEHEPFGLGTALLLHGAETVHLTLWTLPTDAALGMVRPDADGVFARLAQAIDHAQASPNPVAALNHFQREQLERWRARPGLDTSPLMWGAAITMTAPRGRNLAYSETSNSETRVGDRTSNTVAGFPCSRSGE